MKQVFFLMVTLFVIGCKKKDNQNQSPIERSERAYVRTLEGSSIKLTDEAIFVKSDLNSNLISVNASQIKFKYIPQFDTIKNGDILYSMATGQYTDGYAVKLSNKNIQGDVITYSVTQPKVEEIFKEFHSNNTYKPNFGNQDFKIFTPNTSSLQLRFFPQVSNFSIIDPKRIKSKSISGNTMTLEYIFWDYDSKYEETTWDQVKATVVIKADANVITSDFSKLVSLTPLFNINGKPRFSIEVTLAYNFDANTDKAIAESCKDAYNLDVVNKRIPLAQISMTGNSPTDILIKPTFIPYIKIGISASTKFTFKTKYENFGADYALSSSNVFNSGSWNRRLQIVEGIPSYDFNTNLNAHFEMGVGIGIEDQILPNLSSVFGEDTKASIGEYLEINGALDMNFIAGADNNGLYCNTFSIVPSFLADFYSEGKITIFGNTVLDLPKQSIWTGHPLRGLQSLDLNICSDKPNLVDGANYKYKVVQLNNKWWAAENWRQGRLFNNNIDYGAFISYPGNTSGGVDIIPSPVGGWRLPTKAEYENLINSLGIIAYSTLTSNASIGFNAKPYGYVINTGTLSLNELNNKAYFLTSNFTNYAWGGDNWWVYCLVIDNTTHTVSVQEVPFFSKGVSLYTKTCYNVRLVRN